MKMIMKTALGKSRYNRSWTARSSHRTNDWSSIRILKDGLTRSKPVRSSSWQNSLTSSIKEQPFINWIVRETLGTVITNTKAIEKIDFN